MTTNDARQAMIDARKERGEQLRALVVSWHEHRTFLNVLKEQTVAIDQGVLELNDDWYTIADEVYAAFTSQPETTQSDSNTET